MLSLQWVTVVQKICPTDGLWVSWPAQLVLLSPMIESSLPENGQVGARAYDGHVTSASISINPCLVFIRPRSKTYNKILLSHGLTPLERLLCDLVCSTTTLIAREPPCDAYMDGPRRQSLSCTFATGHRTDHTDNASHTDYSDHTCPIPVVIICCADPCYK